MAALEDIGTLAWARQTGGRLSPSEQQAMLDQISAAFAGGEHPGLATTQEGLARVDSGKIRIPDSRTARESEALIAHLCRPSLANHCYRTYLWGSLLAQHDNVAIPDEEAFYVASLLHDLGLTEAHFCRHEGVHCFAVEGAVAADEFLGQQNWEQARRDVVAEAISLHLNLMVEMSRGPLAHYLSAGARCDVVGGRAADLPQPSVEDILRRYPAHDIKEHFVQLLVAEAQARPDSRMALMLANIPPTEFFPFVK